MLHSAAGGTWRRRRGACLRLLLAAWGLGLASGAMASGLVGNEQSWIVGDADSSCRWSEPNGNTAYPETHARYFRVSLPRIRPPGLRLRLDGYYLPARYFSLQLYGAAFNALDALADYQLTPAAGSQTPFAGLTRIDPAVTPGGRYTAYIEFRAAPARRAPNTLYAGDLSLPGVKLYLRAYLSHGALRLPTLSYESERGPLLPGLPPARPVCSDDEAGSSVADAGNESRSSEAETAGLLPSLIGSRDVSFEIYRGVAGGLAGSGVIYNQNAGFMAATIRSGGDLVLVRSRAPSYPRPDGLPVPDVRYWSLCQNRKLSQAVIACVADRDAVVDRSGFQYTLIGNGRGRPAGADARHGFAYLPAAGLDAGYLIYRQLLASPDFVGAISRVPERGDPETALGDYAPRGVYCRPAVFADGVAAGRSPAQVYADCRAAG